MTERLPRDVEELLEHGELCHVGTSTHRGPHVTPTVFALAGGRVWVTTARSSVKARAWRRDPSASCLVRVADVSLVFTGSVRTFDVLDVDSWARDLLEAPALAAASARFTKKNARFFAGYAVDAHHVPFSWMPPGRVFAAIELERAAILGPDGVAETFGAWPRRVVSGSAFRATRAPVPTMDALPEDVAEPLGDAGSAALAVEGSHGLVVLPAGWTEHRGYVYAALAREELALAGLADARPRAALEIDRASWWRARHMTGAMIRGVGEVSLVGELVSGAASAAGIVEVAGGASEGSALVRLRPEELVWWRGWSSGTVTVG